jgi:hypothetical protein
LVEKNEVCEVDDSELVCWEVVAVTWLDNVDLIDEILLDSVVIIVEKLDGLWDAILLGEVGVDDIGFCDK